MDGDGGLDGMGQGRGCWSCTCPGRKVFRLQSCQASRFHQALVQPRAQRARTLALYPLAIQPGEGPRQAQLHSWLSICRRSSPELTLQQEKFSLHVSKGVIATQAVRCGVSCHGRLSLQIIQLESRQPSPGQHRPSARTAPATFQPEISKP